MPRSYDTSGQTGNRLLDALPGEELRPLLPHLELVSLDHGQVLIRPEEPIPFAYFPAGALLSLLTELRDGGSIEAAAVGREGMGGVPILLAGGVTPTSMVTQVPGDAYRVRARVVLEAFECGGALQKLLYRYIHALIVVGAQSVACMGMHPLGRRLARWLLASADAVGSAELHLTHEYLALTLGVRRASVTEAALRLREEGLISYARGAIRILDREGLEGRACECYGAVRQEFERLYAAPARYF